MTDLCLFQDTYVEKGFNVTSRIMHNWLNQTVSVSSTEAQTAAAPLSYTPSFIDKLVAHESAEQIFAPLGKQVREFTETSRTTWVRLALGNGPNEKIFAVMLGYVVIGVAVALYLNVLTVGSMQSAGRAVRNAVRQQLLVVKVSLAQE